MKGVFIVFPQIPFSAPPPFHMSHLLQKIRAETQLVVSKKNHARLCISPLLCLLGKQISMQISLDCCLSDLHDSSHIQRANSTVGSSFVPDRVKSFSGSAISAWLRRFYPVPHSYMFVLLPRVTAGVQETFNQATQGLLPQASLSFFFSILYW